VHVSSLAERPSERESTKYRATHPSMCSCYRGRSRARDYPPTRTWSMPSGRPPSRGPRWRHCAPVGMGPGVPDGSAGGGAARRGRGAARRGSVDLGAAGNRPMAAGGEARPRRAVRSVVRLGRPRTVVGIARPLVHRSRSGDACRVSRLEGGPAPEKKRRRGHLGLDGLGWRGSSSLGERRHPRGPRMGRWGQFVSRNIPATAMRLPSRNSATFRGTGVRLIEALVVSTIGQE